jgi:hypothetical protein
VSGSDNGTLRVWSVTGVCERVLRGHEQVSEVFFLSLYPNAYPFIHLSLECRLCLCLVGWSASGVRILGLYSSGVGSGDRSL